MKDLASWALNTATQRGATYADVRLASDRSRALATKNGKIGNASDAQSQGMSVRVIVDGAWGFAFQTTLTRAGTVYDGRGKGELYCDGSYPGISLWSMGLTAR